MTTLHTQLPESVCDLPLPTAAACKAAADTASKAADSAIENLADLLINGFTRLLRVVTVWWTNLPSPDLLSTRGGSGSALAAVRDYTSELQALFLTTGIVLAAARLALAKRGAAAGEAQEAFLMLARAVIAASLLGTVIAVATSTGDAFAEWVLYDAAGADLTATVQRMSDFDASGGAGLGAGVLIVIGLLGVISSLIQLAMLVVRQALLILVVAVIPIVAAASGTTAGGQAYKKLLSWALAFVLWKPVGALVYAVAFTVAGRADKDDTHTFLLGLILLLMTVVVLPALIRLVAPAVATLGGGGGASAVLAGAAVGTAMSAAGNRSQARPMSETDSGSATSGASSSGSGSGGGSGSQEAGGRVMAALPSGSGGSSAGGGGSGGSGGGGGVRTGGGTGQGASAGQAAGSGGASGMSGAAAAGPAGAAVIAAHAGAAALQQAASLAGQALPPESAATDMDMPGPGEVRR
ncbi:hypothetical protein [Nocardia thailandica]|uniref:hypothetical protein n=1 Tax=Nocardia thailandica TaxID=257275 RepID=UPI0002DBC794|nr:hypothetical protein [Nocardia thailandica]